jgi:hypothetical protein
LAEDTALRPLLPGASFARAQRLVTSGLAVFGCVIGVGIASALLHYDGTHPVNVSWYLFVLVLLQILLAAITASVWALRRFGLLQAAAQDLSLLSQMVRPLFARVGGWIRHQRLAHLPPEARERAKARAGLLQSHYALYGPASYLPVLIAAQVFGIGFNLGAISTTVALEWFSDLAFGWGSALDVQPQTVHDLTRFIALPWSWAFGEGLGYPTLEQIAGSRIYLKDPLSTLDADHLRAWRWFLVLAVATYGLLPRLLLLAVSVRIQAGTLAALPFTHQRSQGLYARLITPSLETAIAGSGTGPDMPIPQPLKPLTAPTTAPRPEAKWAAPADSEPTEAKRTQGERPAQRTRVTRPLAEDMTAYARVPAIAADACVLMIHLDVADMLEEPDQIRLQRMLLAHTGWKVAVSVTIGGGSAMADQAIALIRDRHWEASPPRIAVVQDGSQPPITEDLRFLRAVRAQAGEQAQILLALVGDPDSDDPLPPVSEFDFSDWQRKIEQMGDPYLRLETLASPDPATTGEAFG